LLDVTGLSGAVLRHKLSTAVQWLFSRAARSSHGYWFSNVLCGIYYMDCWLVSAHAPPKMMGGKASKLDKRCAFSRNPRI
jgi:hypothetical protein